MDRYDFIRFGEQVRWYNESEDLMETMQVCCPVYPPVQGDTRVQLVSAGIEALQSGYGSEKTVRASQLVPFVSHFGRGYWEALTQAADNGAGTYLLEAMIRNGSLGLGEQICLLCGKASASVHAAFCRVYPEEGSLLDVIEWQGKEYPIRKLTLFRGTEQEMETTVSVTALQKKLIGRRSGAPVSKAAERIDEGIYYYCEQEKEFLLPQEGLTAFVERG